MSGVFMKSIRILITLLAALPALVWAASAEINYDMEAFEGDLENKPSLQSGMRTYMNYCLGCHTLKFQRYERSADDLGIPHEIALQNLILTDQKIGGLITNAMSPEKAKSWFGAAPPDLTMITRYKSPEYVYNYLKAFYVDHNRPFGVNNKVFENVGLPNALLDLQGVQRSRCDDAADARCDELYLEEGTGSMSPEEFDAAVYDLTNFLYYVGEPSRLERHRLGIAVMLFLVILACFTYLLNREYWKDVH
ncbi:MAG: cytochrome c1 [Pseudomonadales bacterium]|nr:cytochrome c1 [Pseudomonadales bacterium]